nr:tRNA dimethylallyltransferase 9 [Tanacetum cinerariifolium]
MGLGRVVSFFVRVESSKDEVVDFIYKAYHNQTGKLVVPRSLAMEKDMSDRQQIAQLKTYRSKREVFVSQEDCSDILDWISNNQRQNTELIAR